MSQRSAREDFWVAARHLGQGAVFPPDAPFESVEDGHLALVDAGLRRTLAISASRSAAGAAGRGAAAAGEAAPGAAESPTSAAPDDLAHASRESLGAVGAVSL